MNKISSGPFGIRHFWQNFSGNPLRIFMLILADLFWSSCIPLGVARFYFNFFVRQPFPDTLPGKILLLSGIIIVCNALLKCYHGSVLNPGAPINRLEEIRRITFSVLGTDLFALLYLLLGKEQSVLLVPLLVSLPLMLVSFPLVRFLVRYLLKKAGIGQTRIFIVGMGKTGRLVGEELRDSVYYGYEVLGYFDDDLSRREMRICGKPCIGRLCDACRLGRYYNVHHIICCLPPTVLPRILRDFTHGFNHVLVIPSNEIFPITALYPVLIGFISAFEFQNRLKFPLLRISKRIMELFFSACCVIVLLPLFLVLAVLVKLSSPGPVFYTARRLGLNGREIKVFKFRTMYQDAEDRLETLLEDNPEMKKEWREKFKLQHDPRITKIGYFLRKTSLDELPQFINVLRGEMSIIGPRPIVPEEVKYYGDAYDFFCRVRPGITGLWQVSGRSTTDYSSRVSMDLFYVMNWSIWLDWFILLKTVLVVLSCRGSC